MPTPVLLDLDDPRAIDASLVGYSAANLAAARAVGLPALGGVVLTHEWNTSDTSTAVDAWTAAAMTHNGVVVRPTTGGIFPATDRHQLADRLQRAASAGRSESVAFLIHPAVDVAWSGRVLGSDPATGRKDHVLLTARHGRPLVDDTTAPAWTGSISRLGRVTRVEDDAGRRPPRWLILRVVHLAHRTTRAFAGPRDVPWVLDRSGHLFMLETSAVCGG
jgi:hypothetical protein